MGGELGRVDEDAGDHAPGFHAGLFHQPQVAVMQGAHGGHEGYRLACGAPAGHDATEVCRAGGVGQGQSG